MKHRTLRIAAVALPLTLGLPLFDCSNVRPVGSAVQSTTIPDMKGAIPTKGSVIIELYSKKCRPCRTMMNEVLGPLTHEQNLQIFKVDVKQDRELALKLAGRSFWLPLVLLFKDGKEVGRIEGNELSLADFKSLLKEKGLL